jgi:hypothetical protein
LPQFDPIATLFYGPPGGQSLLVDGLRIRFQIKKTETPEPNTATIVIFNTGEDTRNLLGTTGNVAILQGGYKQDPANVRILCEMDVIDAQSTVQPPITSTTIICADGMNAKRSPPKSHSYTAGKSAKDIITEVVKDAGLTLRDMGGVANDIYNNGFSEAGFFDDIMNKLTAKLQARWSVQNGEVVVSPLDQPAEFTTIKLNNGTGLIHTQRRNKIGAPETPGQKDGWVARAELLPIAEPGVRVALESEQVSAIFKVSALTHVGDTHAREWFTDLELEEFD